MKIYTIFVACPKNCRTEKCYISTYDVVTCTECEDFWYEALDNKECKGKIIFLIWYLVNIIIQRSINSQPI